MRALIYLILHTLKNKILGLKKKPGLLICYLIMIVSGGFLLISGPSSRPGQVSKDSTYIVIILSGIALLFIYSYLQVGLTRGGTLFSMADATLLFVAPISSRRILIYGLVRQMGVLVLSTLFILYQIPNLVATFGFHGKDIIALLFAYFLMLFSLQLLSIWIFLTCHDSVQKGKQIKLGFYLGVALLGAYVLYHYAVLKEPIITAVFSLLKAKWFLYVPILGWNVAILNGSMAGNLAMVFFSISAYVTVILVMIYCFTKREADFYESVLASTEKMDRLVRDSKEGRVVNQNTKKIRVKETGISAGCGANAIFYRQLKETKRKHGTLWFLHMGQIVLAIAAGIFMNSVKQEFSIYVLFGALMYLEFIFLLSGLLDGDLKKHYIYLIPEPSVKKLFYSTCLPLVGKATQSILVIGVAGVVGKLSVLMTVACMLAYFTSCALWNFTPILIRRIFGGEPGQLLSVMMRMLFGFMCLIPGVILASICGVMTRNPSSPLIFLGFAVANVFIAAILYYACRNLFDRTN